MQRVSFIVPHEAKRRVSRRVASARAVPYGTGAERRTGPAVMGRILHVSGTEAFKQRVRLFACGVCQVIYIQRQTHHIKICSTSTEKGNRHPQTQTQQLLIIRCVIQLPRTRRMTVV